MFENKILGKIFGLKNVNTLHNVELHNLCGNADIITMLKSCRLQWVGHVALIIDGRRAYKVLLRKPEGNCPPGI